MRRFVALLPLAALCLGFGLAAAAAPPPVLGDPIPIQ